jgi:hypothetical protein
MLGILYLLFYGSVSGINKIRQDINNINKRYEAKQKKYLTYYGKNGERLVNNDRPVYRKTINGEKLLVDLYTGKIYKNFSEEERQNKENDAYKLGKTVISVSYDEIQEYNRKERFNAKSINVKPQYKDIKTRKYYLSVFVNGLTFYMDIITGKIIRLADNQNINKKWGKLSIEEIISIINKRQEEMYNSLDKHDQFWWEDHFYLQKKGSDIIIVDNDGSIIEGNLKDKRVQSIKKRLKEEICNE